MEKYLITSWNTTTPSKRERERKKERERETFQKDERGHFFVAFECKVRAVAEREYSRMKDMCDVVLDATFMSKRRDTFSPYHKRERTKKLLSFSKSGERRKDGERRYMYTYISNIYRFVGVTGIIIIIIIIYRSSRSSTGSIKTCS